MSRRKKRSSPWMAFAHVGIIALVMTMIIPIYYVVVSSLKDNTAILVNPFGLPLDLEFSNFVDAFRNAQLGRGLLNSAYITLGAEAFTLALAIPAAFGIARAKGRLAVATERFFALGFLIPPFAALVPTAILAITLGMFHTKEFLILFLSATALPLSIILLVQAMRAVPAELHESAEMDGAGVWRTLIAVFMPLTAPTLATVAILNFLSFWNEYFFALVIAGPDPQVRTAQVALPTLTSVTNTQYGVLAAGIVITLLPVYLVYVMLAKRMQDAVLSGAVKG